MDAATPVPRKRCAARVIGGAICAFVALAPAAAHAGDATRPAGPGLDAAGSAVSAAWRDSWQRFRAHVEISRARGVTLISRGWCLAIQARLARVEEPTLALPMQVEIVLARRWTW